jgi:hypothetical protein
MKLALMLGGMAAGRSVGGPGELLGAGTKILGSSPELAKLTDIVRSRLLEAGKGAVVAVATRQIESLTDRVGKRVESLGDVGAPGRGKAAEAPATDEYPEDEYAEDEYAGSEPAEDEDTAPADEAPQDEEEPARERAETPRRRPRAPADKARAARTGSKTSSATATLKRTAPGASGVGRTASKASAARKPSRTARTQRGDGDG